MAFEYLKRERPEQCRSVVLSSTPTNVAEVENAADELVQELLVNGSDESNLGEAFRKTYQVQTEKQPIPLADAYAAAGSTTFRGTTAISDYVASFNGDDSSSVDMSIVETPALVLRGEYDFVTAPCIEGWKNLFHNVKVHELAGVRPPWNAGIAGNVWPVAGIVQHNLPPLTKHCFHAGTCTRDKLFDPSTVRKCESTVKRDLGYDHPQTFQSYNF